MSNLFRVFGRFGEDRNGNMGVIFAITLVPILGLIGAGVDYSLVNRARSAMQNALELDRTHGRKGRRRE